MSGYPFDGSPPPGYDENAPMRKCIDCAHIADVELDDHGGTGRCIVYRQMRALECGRQCRGFEPRSVPLLRRRAS